MFFAQAMACQISRMPNIIVSLFMIGIGGIGTWATIRAYMLIRRRITTITSKDIRSTTTRGNIRAFLAIFLHRPNMMKLPVVIAMASFVSLVTLLGGLVILVASILGLC